MKQSNANRLRFELKMVLLKEQIEEKGYNWCVACGKTEKWLELAHIIALSRGGETTRENCRLWCQVCHTKISKH